MRSRSSAVAAAVTAAVAAVTLTLLPGSQAGAQASAGTQSAAPQPPSAPAPSPRATLGAAVTAMSRESVRSGIVTALTAAMRDSATLLLDQAPVIRGRDAITATLKAQRTLDSLRVEFMPQLLEVSADGGFGVSWGVMVVQRPSGANQPSLFGRYLSAWRRGPDGRWTLEAFAPLGPAFPGVRDAATIVRGIAPAIAPRGAPFAQADAAFAAAGARTGGAPSAFGSFAAPDAVTFPADGLAITPMHIRARMEAGGSGALAWQWKPVVADGAADGTLGFTVGEAIITAKRADGSAEPNYTKYLSLWQRQADGSLRYLSDGGNNRRADNP